MFMLIMGVALLLFGMLTLILTMGYKNMETERAQTGSGEVHVTIDIPEPHFFGLDQSPASQATRNTRGAYTTADLTTLVGEVEQYLRQEKSLAEKFMDKPSVANLHRRSKSAPWTN